MTEQLLLLAVGDPRVQVVLMKVPFPDVEKVTVPLGAEALPAGCVSVTMAVQVVACPAVTAAGLQLTVVLVLRVALRANELLLLEWRVLPP